MSFDNLYPNRKDNRRQYNKKAQRFDRSCRCHGGCSYCLGNRIHKKIMGEMTATEKMMEYNDT